MQRRSTNRTTPRKRYTVDAFDGIDALQDDAKSDDETLPTAAGDDDDADDFAEEDEDVPDDNESASTEDDNENEPDDDSPASEQMSEDGKSNFDDATRPVKSRRTRRVEVSSGNLQVSKSAESQSQAGKTYSRGLRDGLTDVHSLGLENRWLFYYGPSSSDVDPVFKARNRWGYATTLPSRSVDDKGCGGLRQSFYLDDSQRLSQIRSTTKWLSDPEKQRSIDTMQVIKTLNKDEAEGYVSDPICDSRLSLVMGPVGKQQMYQLSTNECMGLEEVWKSSPQDELPAGFKNGFVFNMGGRVHALDWAANQPGLQQYLAVSIVAERDDWSPEFDTLNSRAFCPQPPQKSTVQIWKLSSTADGRIDTHRAPIRAIVLCTEWGYARQLKWCPVSHDLPETPNGKRIGLLGSTWYDGSIRVLDVVDPSPSGTETSYVEMEESFFYALPPDTVCTSLTWIDGRRIAAACANGCIAVWDLPSCLGSGSRNARPSMYTSIAESSILNITSCGPSRPNILATCSVSGKMAVTDISRPSQSASPHTSTAYSQRNRVMQPAILWHESSQVVLQLEDNNFLRGLSIRRFFAAVGLGRYHSIGCCIAGSPVHPFVLVGTLSGEVVSQNPTARALDGKAQIFQQNWFSHGWRRNAADDERHAADTQGRGDVPPPHLREPNLANPTGLTRILEGQKVDRVVLIHESLRVPDHPDRVIPATIFEGRSAISALAWNPNPHVGGWAAAGCADGFFRVEDIAI